MTAVQRLLAFAGCLVLLGCPRRPLTPVRTTLDEAPPRLVSAFFGLDDALPEGARGLCWSAPGKDGLPVTFSRRVAGAVAPESFTVWTRSGVAKHPTCATTRPADERAERHTVLLIGELGSEPGDPPMRVEVTGPLALEGGADALGLSVNVTPLADGPTLVLALGLPVGSLETDCPAPRTKQVVLVVWAGGVRPGPGKTAADHLAGYEVDTAGGVVRPFALGDLDDRDNDVHLCLETNSAPVRVRFSAGVVVDPRGDLNPATVVEVSPSR